MLDDMLEFIETLPRGPVWRAPTPQAKAALREPLPVHGQPLASVHDQFCESILPFHGGNCHPGFLGWVQGGGTPVGMLADMLASGMNANVGGRNHIAVEVERQIAQWMAQLFAFPDTANGLFLTGASQANFVALVIARNRMLGDGVRRTGLEGRSLVAYASAEVHGCVPRAMDMAGIGSHNLRRVPVGNGGGIDLSLLRAMVAGDLAAGFLPFMLVGTAGTVNTGAVDDLDGMADMAKEFSVHFHVDGALGAMGVLSSQHAPLFAGIERSDSLAFDFHKWGQVPYDAGFLLVRDAQWSLDSFGSDDAYLTRTSSGLAAGDAWPCDYGPDLSRGFRALKTWFTLKTYGTAALGDVIARTCQLASYLANRIRREPQLQLLAPVRLNIVCFAYKADTCEAQDALNVALVEALHVDGRVAPSLTIIGGRKAIRAAFVNHRTTVADVDALVDRLLELSDERPTSC